MTHCSTRFHRKVNDTLDPHRIQRAVDRVFPEDAMTFAIRTLTSWTGYAETPLIDLPDISRRLGIARIGYKDEASRFGLGSFKALGGAYAVSRVLERDNLGTESDPQNFTVISATAGNHGRSVAWGAQRVGCRCIILVHPGVSLDRRDAIAAYGAEIREVPGTYDDSVDEAFRLAAENGWTVVSDTSRQGYEDIPSLVMHGYGVMIEEAITQWGDEPPTHVFVQVGVGGLAAAVLQGLWRRWANTGVRFVCVEPAAADCFFQSVEQGSSVKIEGELATMMVCLACGEMSSRAWEVLSAGATDAIRIDDMAAAQAMRLLAGDGVERTPVIAGESGAAGLAALVVAAGHPELASGLGLTPDSRVLLSGSEGALDPSLFRTIVGWDPDLATA
ncbi:diaminopropionate ammonia-lyase [Microvirga sp. ACRRW]|uniref:diaminopropionate ammonia-lyase n=1 Tax=Microvirga sp. ACRRW TaxID=2918205 RepID=UPI001EF6C28E|nr:diaminopropionate ammonia-lyase [Microvirga sp. ACRRW]MCG7393395.1 diaminopropionate ammonia-lyase [Microvirga sp. ACRRW]